MRDQPKISKELVRTLEDMRRANNGIRSCVRLLSEDMTNQGCLPAGSEPYVRFDVETQIGLVMAAEACSTQIADAFSNLEEGHNYPIGWDGNDHPEMWHRSQGGDGAIEHEPWSEIDTDRLGDAA